ncbi:methyl-accepting chemotaxis protein [Petroclostridium sp. X23]|nr:methyl-accepting chemotaxis protein [Petroclostridium sp. X23]WHH61636.1 methyl-accepting chemotaxis protein [Petroclostridium sp. X23]
MKWFANLKLRTKLLTGFIIIALISGIIGIVSMYEMSVLNNRTSEMYNNRLVPIADLGAVVKNLARAKANTYLLVYDENAQKLSERIAKADQITKEDNEIIERYAATYLVEDEKKGLEELISSLEPYRKIRNELYDVIKEGNYEKARQMRVTFDEYDLKVAESLDKLISINNTVANNLNERNKSDYKTNSATMIIIIVTGIAIALGLGFVIAGMISKPILKILDVAEKIANGDLDVNVDINTKDEVGMLANAFRNMTNNLNDVMSNISVSSEQVAVGASQVSNSSMALSQGATEQASSIEQLTASLEEISSQTNLNAENATQANEFAEAAKFNAVQGNCQMKEMLKAMDEINDSSGNISKIIKVIDEIAFQTNILALNAAVEAARAGQHGKGFAVVAEEVRNLAARSANAAKETTDMIEGSIKKVEGGTKIANETAGALDKIVDGVTKVAGLVSDIAVASNEQALGIAQVNQGIMQVSEVVQTNSATSEESAAASEELASQAQTLKEQVARFKLKKNQHSEVSYNGLEKLSPEVLKILNNINMKKKESSDREIYSEAAAASTKKIALSDNEFGKY